MIQNAIHHHDLVNDSTLHVVSVISNPARFHRSFAQLARQGVRQQTHKLDPYPYGHSGFAWAATRQFYENTGGLMDFPILGSADHHMAWAAIGNVGWSVHKGMTDAFKRRCREWQDRAVQVTHRFLNYVPGRIEHHWHGKKSERKYRERWKILVDNKFNPDTDLRKDAQGLWRIVGKPKLREEIHRYFAGRREDSIDEY